MPANDTTMDDVGFVPDQSDVGFVPDKADDGLGFVADAPHDDVGFVPDNPAPRPSWKDAIYNAVVDTGKQQAEAVRPFIDTRSIIPEGSLSMGPKQYDEQGRFIPSDFEKLVRPLATPQNAAITMATAGGGTLARVAGVGFGAMGAKGTYEAAKVIADPKASKQQKDDARLSLFANVPMAVAGAHGALHGEPGAVASPEPATATPEGFTPPPKANTMEAMHSKLDEIKALLKQQEQPNETVPQQAQIPSAETAPVPAPAATEKPAQVAGEEIAVPGQLQASGEVRQPDNEQPLNPGGAEPDLPEAKQAISQANNSLEAWGDFGGLNKETITPEEAGVHPSSQLQMAIVPGAKEFIEQDVLPAAKQLAKGVSDSVEELNAAFRAPNKSDLAAQTAGIVRHNAAELAQKDVQIRAKLEDARKVFEAQSPADNLQFIDNMEQGRPQPSGDLNRISGTLRAAFDDRVAQVRALGTGKLEKLIENYFPHLWEQPTPAQGLYSIIFGKRPLEGPKSFLKKRTIPTTADGIAAGLKPVSTNPVELTLLKLHEMDRYIMAHKVLNEMKDAGLAKFVKATDLTPDGHTKIDDRIADVYEGTTAQGSLSKRGSYYAPDDAARIINNYLSPGLRKYALFRGAIGVSNTLNQCQLGLSGYHLRFTAIDSAVSKLALGLEKVARGDYSGAIKDVGLSATAPLGGPAFENYVRGNKVLQEYTKPGTVGGDFAAIADALVKGGGRVQMDKFYKNSSVESFWNALKSGNHFGAVLRFPFAAIEGTSKPIMEVIVPRMKLGIFADMARAEMQRNPTMTLAEQRVAFGKIWDSVDNRMGQMVYDNLFWNKTLKDAAMLSTRSLGWNLGTVRELGGGIKDSATMLSRIKAGDSAITHRMAYTAALPIIVGMLGAVYQYLHTGKGPEELQDYYLPKTGETMPDGSPERVILPTYMKDIIPVVKAGQNFGTAGVLSRTEQMAINKTGSLVNMIASMLQNRDFYGTEIAHKGDPLMDQVGQEMKFVASQFKPFTLAQSQHRIAQDAQSKYESFTGIMPANKELTRTKSMQMIAEYNAQHFGGTMTQAEQAKREAKAPKPGDPRINAFKRLPVDVATEVFNAGTDEEKSLWKPFFDIKKAK